MTKSDRFPASSFGATLQATLRAGANKEVRLTFDTEALATRFMQRLNGLRAAMKREEHPDWEQLYRCGVHRDLIDKKIVVISPRDSEFNDTLKRAGIATEIPLPERVEHKVMQSSHVDAPIDPADAFLAELRDELPKK